MADEEKNTTANANEKADANGKKQSTAAKKTEPAKKETAEKKEPAAKQSTASTQSSGTSVDDATTKKIIYSLCYLFGILFFLPLILYKNDAEATRHANQGLVLLIFAVVGNVLFGILTIIPVLNIIFKVIAGLYSLALLILCIIGIVYVITDRNEELPILGSIHILK